MKVLIIIAGMWMAYLISVKYGFFCGLAVFLIFLAVSKSLCD